MENEIETAAKSYFEENDSPFGEPNYPIQPAFRSGARWMLEQYNGVSPETVKEMANRINNFESELREAFYKGREIDRYNERGLAIFKRPTFEGYLRELNEKP